MMFFWQILDESCGTLNEYYGKFGRNARDFERYSQEFRKKLKGY
jgi:hypothetical protein